MSVRVPEDIGIIEVRLVLFTAAILHSGEISRFGGSEHQGRSDGGETAVMQMVVFVLWLQHVVAVDHGEVGEGWWEEVGEGGVTAGEGDG